MEMKKISQMDNFNFLPPYHLRVDEQKRRRKPVKLNDFSQKLPNHVTTALTISSCAIQSTQRPVSKFTTKNGSQQLRFERHKRKKIFFG